MIDCKTHILIFDDEELVGNIVCKMLEHFGYATTHAMTCSDAFNKYQEQLKTPNAFIAVLADLNVPGGDGGRQLASQILQIDPSAQIFATSGNTLEDAMQNPQDFGFIDKVTKPITLDVIKAFLSKLKKGAD